MTRSRSTRFTGHMALTLAALVFALNLTQSNATSNFSRPFQKMKDSQIVTFLAENPSLSVQLSDMHFARYVNENERLVQGLILPMLFDQRVTLLASRYHTLSGAALDPFLDKFIDTIDDTPNSRFFLEFIVAPSYPLYRTFRQLDSQSSLDETLQFIFAALSVIEVLRFAAALLNLYVSKKTSGASFLSWLFDQRHALTRFVAVSLFALTSYFFVWNPLVYRHIPRVFICTVSLVLASKVKTATSQTALAFLVAIVPHICAYFIFGVHTLMAFESEIPLKILSHCVMLALPFSYALQAYKISMMFFKNLQYLFRMFRRWGPPPPVPPVVDDRLVPIEDMDFKKSLVLGKGGFGTVVTATYFSAKVAVKFISVRQDGTKPDFKALKSLENEVATRSFFLVYIQFEFNLIIITPSPHLLECAGVYATITKSSKCCSDFRSHFLGHARRQLYGVH